MKRKFTLLLMALLALAGFKSWGQETITVQIGEGANPTYNLPFNSYYSYSYNEMLFKASEINDAAQSTISSGTINSISFQAYWGNSGTTSFSYDIYMKNVDRTDYDDGGWATVSESDKVKSGTITSGVNDWVELALDSPFQWDGTKNLLIVFDADNPGKWVQTNFYYDYPGFNCCHTVYSDSYNYEPSSSYPTDGNMSVTSYRPNIKLNMDVVTATTYAINLTQPDAAVGTISSNPATEAAEGATVTLSANLNHGYEFDSWTVTNTTTTESITVTNNQFTMPGSAVNVMANITELSPRSVNITNPTDGGNTTATLSATPNTGVFKDDEVRLSYSDLAEGYKFVNYVATNASTSEPIAIQEKWDGTLYQNYYYFIMPDADVNLTANVKLIRTINVAEMQHGNLSISPNPQYQQITAGETITINPNPNYGYQLETLTITKVSGGTITPEQQEQWGEIVYTFEMPEDDVNIAATFTATGTLYTVTLPEETEIGRVSARPVDSWENSTEYFENDNVCLNVYVKDSHHHIGSVVVTKDSNQEVVDFYEQSGDYYYFVMPADDVTVTATFEEDPRYLVSIVAANGTVNLIDAPTGNSYYKGQQVKFNVTPDAGYVIDDVTYTCEQSINIWYNNNEGYYYFTMPEAPVTINASFVVGITIHDGTGDDDWIDNIPILGSYTDVFNTKSQFIFPAAELTAISSSNITDLTFYTKNVGSNNFQTKTWNVFMKEVNYTTPSSSFIDWNDMTSVYHGTITISDDKLKIHLSTPFEYNGGNLMIGFRENEYGGNYFYTQWRGDYNNYDAYHSVATNTSGQPEQSCFLPKTTIIYEPVVKYDITLTQPGTEVGTIHAFANGVEVSQASEGTEITLQYNFNLGYQFLNWSVNGEPIQGNTFTMPATAVTVAANYEALTSYDIICATIEHGEILAQYQGVTITEAYEGMQIDLVANLDEGYAVTEWTVNGTPIEGSSFIMPANDVNVNATVIQRLEFTVNDGYDTNGNVPIYGLYADEYATQSEFIIPKETLTALKNTQLIGLTFYSTASNHDFGNPTWKVYLKEVNKTVASIPYENTSTMTLVYSGTMKVQDDGKLTINFSSPITYSGNNLMIMFEQQSAGATCSYSSWYGVSTSSNTSLATNYYNEYWGSGFEDVQFQFLPKTTFAYTPAPQFAVTLADVENGTIEADPMEAAAGATIQLTATPDPHYQFGSWTTTPEVEINENNQFIMPEGGITVSATFISLPEYEITFMANGVQDGTASYEQGATIDRVPGSVPAGMTFAGWVAEDIATFTEQAPVYTTTANQAMTLYAVFSYTDENGGTAWNKVTDVTTLANNDQIIIASEAEKMILCQRAQGGLTCQAEVVNIENGQIANISDNAIVFTLESSTGNQWHLLFNDNFDGNTSIAALNTYLAPVTSYPAFNNEWVISGNGIQNVGDNSYISYVSYEEWSLFYFGTDYVAANAAQLYKKGIGSKTYYMTEVFVIDEATSLTEDMTKRNVIIADGASLNINANVTLNVAGACFNPSHDAAQLVIADGGQLIHNNAGTVATMKKNITGTEWYTISSPLANSVEFAEVENLIPTTVEADDYDLYRLNEAEGIWENSRIEDQSQNEFTTIDKGLGYIYANNAGANYIAFAGEINVEDVECTLTNGKTNGFNLIGNPFMQNIELANVTGVSLADGFYVLSNEGDWGAKLTDSDIKPLQGFLVQATTAGTATIEKPAASSKGGRSNEHNTNIEMIVSNSNHRDNAYAVFGEGIGLNKISHRNAEAPMLYIPQDGENFAIAYMNENTTVFPLNFKAMTTGKYSISLKATDDINTLVLVDNMTGVETNMLLESSYSFIGSPADRENRFTVKLGISHNDNNENEQFVYQYGNELIINGEGTLQIFDVLGRVVISEEVHGQRVNIGNLVKGTYIVRMTGENVMTQKIIVK